MEITVAHYDYWRKTKNKKHSLESDFLFSKNNKKTSVFVRSYVLAERLWHNRFMVQSTVHFSALFPILTSNSQALEIVVFAYRNELISSDMIFDNDEPLRYESLDFYKATSFRTVEDAVHIWPRVLSTTTQTRIVHIFVYYFVSTA